MKFFRQKYDTSNKHDNSPVTKADINSELKLKAGTTTGNGIIAFLNSSGTTKGNIFYDTDDNFMHLMSLFFV